MKTYKTEIKLNKEQITKFNRTIGTCRFIYNFYISHNKEIYEKENRFVSANEFSKFLNNKFLKENEEYLWIKEVSSKSVKRSILNAEKSFKNFFNKKSKFPKFKKKKDNSVKYYFTRNSLSQQIKYERHKINIPCLGHIYLKEKNYIKNNIISGTVSKKADRFYVSVITDRENIIYKNNINDGIGVDLGINKLAVLSNGIEFYNINKTRKMKKINKKLRREQRGLSRKYEVKKKEQRKENSKNYETQVVKIQKIHQILNSIRDDYNNKVINSIIQLKPNFITVENLNIRGMLKNKHLSKSIKEQGLFNFKTKLLNKCNENSIELREVGMFFPSSKICSNCGNKKQNLKLSDRIYKCSNCNTIIDRDYNASLNLKNCKEYKILTVPMACRELTTVENQTNSSSLEINERGFKEAVKSVLVNSNNN
jgi:putative transposase